MSQPGCRKVSDGTRIRKGTVLHPDFVARRILYPLVPALALVLVVLCLLALPGSALAARQVPVGLANTNDQNLRDSRWLYAIRFVVDEDTKLYRFFSQMKAKGASWDEHSGSKCSSYGAGCYGAGDGGRIQARLVPVRPDGTPDLSRVLAQETVDPRTRYAETKAAYSIKLISLFWYFNMGGVALKAGTPYAMVYRNVHGDPAHNFTSTNSPTVKESEAGPNGRNNLDPNAAGAIAGLDPREAVAWSTDDGRTWKWGRQVGPTRVMRPPTTGRGFPITPGRPRPHRNRSPISPTRPTWEHVPHARCG